jgi:hypothetical protein
MSAEKYINENRGSLLSIYSQILSSEELSCEVFDKKLDDRNKKDICKKTIVVHKYLNGEVDFPINLAFLKPKDSLLVEELYSIMLCEEFVKAGKLTRNGDIYEAIIDWDFKVIPKFKKYVKGK